MNCECHVYKTVVVDITFSKIEVQYDSEKAERLQETRIVITGPIKGQRLRNEKP